jgi:hypothetical protein
MDNSRRRKLFVEFGGMRVQSAVAFVYNRCL